jgi:xanthine dehydrogenase YagT iron-sulfur-binding subunit
MPLAWERAHSAANDDRRVTISTASHLFDTHARPILLAQAFTLETRAALLLPSYVADSFNESVEGWGPMSERDKAPADDVVIGIPRREFLRRTTLVGGGLAVSQGLLNDRRGGPPESSSVVMPGATGPVTTVHLNVNGREVQLRLEPRTTLLDALRDGVGLTGTKKGCDRGECGACTVHVEGRRVLSCMTLAAMQDGKPITTIEGLEQRGRLHPLQAAFIEHDGFQCGFCTSGQIMSGVAMIEEARKGWPSAATTDLSERTTVTDLSELEIRERMSGNLCRCACYPNIVAAIADATKRG